MGPSLDEKTSAQVLRQVEFYFSDSNLPGDKFLRQCVEVSKDGLVSLPLICSFGRMRNHLKLQESGPDNVPAETTAAVAEVLRKSTVLTVSDDGQKVGRIAPLLKLDEVQAAVDARSISAGPLRWTVTMEEVETFFSQHVKVNSVRLPRHPVGRAFCGFALVELCSEDDAKKVLELKTSFDGIELEIKPKRDFDAEMEKWQAQQQDFSSGSRGQHPRQSFEHRNKSMHKNANPEEPSYTKGLIVAFSLQKMSRKDDSVAENKENATVDLKEGDLKEGEAPKEASATSADKEPENEANQILREDVKDAFKVYGTIMYIDFNRGATSGYLRFEKPEEAQKARTAAVLAEAGGITVKDHIATLEAVEGEAEQQYWAKVRIFQERVRGESGRGSRGGGRGSRNWPRRDNKFDRSGGRMGEQHENKRGKPENDTKFGKHERFQETDSEDETDHPSKQSKSEDIPS